MPYISNFVSRNYVPHSTCKKRVLALYVCGSKCRYGKYPNPKRVKGITHGAELARTHSFHKQVTSSLRYKSNLLNSSL